MINDHEWSARSLESILVPYGYAILRAYTGANGIERAQRAAPDLILVDENLPDMSGIELCRQLRESGSVPARTPIIVTTADHPTRSQRLAALQAGAWAFLGHPLDGEELVLLFEGYMRAKIEADELQEEGLVDDATGLYNARGLARRAQEIASRAMRRSEPLACVVFQLGGDAGGDDAAPSTAADIEHFAHVLRQSGRASDIMGRVAPSDLVVYMGGTDAEGAARFAQRIAAALAPEGEAAAYSFKAGYDGVPNYREAALDPLSIVERASAALERYVNGSDEDGWLHPFVPDAVGPDLH